jgi:type II pantothenate kinase
MSRQDVISGSTQSAIANRQSATAAEPFVLLAQPGAYVACDWDLAQDAEGRRHWVSFFSSHVRTILDAGMESGVKAGQDKAELERAADACVAEFVPFFEAFDRQPAGRGRVTILTLDAWRDDILHRHGFVDAFAELKRRENEKMLPLLPEVCRRHDALDGDLRGQLRAVIEGVFAGNIFDMGARATAERFKGESPDFHRTVETLPRRPWRIDQYDELEERVLHGPPYRHAVIFIDNAGSDFLLGALPLARWLGRRGARVVIAANERPTLNDMTVHDVRAWWPRILDAEPSLRELPIEIVSTGTGEPLIDLSAVSTQLNDASRGADLVVIEGMGRGVESNLNAVFTCDAMNLAMLKDEAVARRVGGEVYDVVCRFRRGET